MPNWCQNSATLTNDDVEKINALLEAAKEENFGLLSYFYPIPEELTDSGWYEWSIENWGTKWDVYPQDEPYQSGENSVDFYFDSAWSPPIEFYNMLQKDSWKVNALYCESGMEYCGEYSNGVQSTFEYDGMTREEARATIPEDIYEFADLDYYFDCKEEEQEDEEE